MFTSASLRLCGLLLFTIHCSLFIATAQTRDYTRHVNPFIGTGGHGHTFPGATMPFGMVQLSPDTRIDNWDGSSGYHYSDDTIYGFSHTHLNGTGIPDYCDILFMPTVGEPQFFAKDGERSVNGYASKFSHANEKAEPGYYSVKLDDDGIQVEMTATKRVGLHRYTFPSTAEKPTVILDLVWRDKVLDRYSNRSLGDKSQEAGENHGIHLNVVSKSRVEGWRTSMSWAKNQRVYFAAEFSKPFEPTVESMQDQRSVRTHSVGNKTFGPNIKAAFSFPSSVGQVLVKVAISHVSIEGARNNLAAELPGWDFDKVRADAKAAWNKELTKIDVSGGTPDQTTTFYTALYHTMIQPNIFNDVDGSYLGMDKKVHSLSQVRKLGPERTAPGAKSDRGVAPSVTKKETPGDQYTVFSLWDTFRAAHPLYTIIDQKRTVDFINTFIRQYEQGGRLPVWELAGEETDTMIGYHAVSVIADAMAKGITGFDYEKAYKASKYSAELDHFGLAGYKKRGYISMEDENESVSRTLEYAYNDWCIAQMAQVLLRRNAGSQPASPEHGQAGSLRSDIDKYSRRARYFENLFDKKVGFFRAKKNGSFVEPFAPNEVTFGFTEGNSWQYSFFVPHDVEHLVKLHGGREKFTAKIDELFNTDQKLAGREQADLTGLIGQYAHGNEPSHHIAYLYNYIGQPWKTQKLVRKIMDEFYKNAPDGLIGNEDCGQMSAWYILSASGFYPVAPGDGVYAFGTPLFPEMTYRLENGKTFTVRAKNVSAKNSYILNAKLNGAPYKKAYLTHADLMKGGVLEFAMTDTPVTTAFTEFPVSAMNVDSVSVPVITGERTFRDKATVSLSTITSNAKIHYTTDGSEPIRTSKEYANEFPIDRTTTVKAIAIGSNGKMSFPVESVLTRRPNDWTVRVFSPYSTQYTGGGDQAIIDGIRGTVNFASGEWQGVQGKTYEAVVDLQRETAIKELGGSFLQVAGPWIWMPDRVEFETSNDGVNFVKAIEIKPGFSQTDLTPTAREYVQKITPTRARFVRMRAYNFGKIPLWHLGAGGDPWIFVDEIIIR